ncbi:MAG: response regulator [Treponema sp.]|nr:response regulator [Treponema sp.]
MKIVFIVDDNNVNLAAADDVLSGYYRVFTLPSASDMFDLLHDIKPDLILLDILMPEMNGFETLKVLKSSSEYADIPVIFLTSRNDSVTESLGFEKGAVDFITKPFSGPVLLNRIKTHLNIEDIIYERTSSLKKLKNGIVSVLAGIVENRDKWTGGHIERMSGYISLFLESIRADELYKDETENMDYETLISASRLHDIGKIVVTDAILNKRDNLTIEEIEVIKTHASEGERIIEEITHTAGDEAFLQCSRYFVGYHHERWDGSGYPYGLKGKDIPLPGRIMAIADVYDALVTERPYKLAFSHNEAVEIISNSSGVHFDPCLVKIFLKLEKEFEKVLHEHM